MKVINETFTDEEFAFIKRVKGKTGENWHDFILNAARKESNPVKRFADKLNN